MAHRLDGLDGLRGVAALAVVGFHYRGINAPGSIWSAGWLSVDLFFLLSGYVIARAYEHRLRSSLSVSSFVGIRYRRLWFAYAVGCSFGLAYLLLHQVNSAVPAYLVQLTFWPSFIVPGQFFPTNTPGWTLYCELFVNVLYASFVARLSNRSVSVLTALVCAAFAVIAVQRGDWMESPDFGNGFLRALAPYMVGVCLFRYRVKPWSAGWFGIAALPVVLGIFVLLPETVRLVLFSLVAAPALFMAALGLQSRAARALGQMSYPLYAVHDPILHLGAELGLSVLATASVTAITVLGIVGIEGRQFFRRPASHADPSQ